MCRARALYIVLIVLIFFVGEGHVVFEIKNFPHGNVTVSRRPDRASGENHPNHQTSTRNSRDAIWTFQTILCVHATRFRQSLDRFYIFCDADYVVFEIKNFSVVVITVNQVCKALTFPKMLQRIVPMN